MATKRDYYEVLGLSKDATVDDIKKAYRTLAKKYHPDVSTEPNATEKFAEIQVAYDCLSDPVKKENYDRFGTEEPGNFGGGFQGGSGDFGGFGFEDIFSSFFGGGRASGTTSDGPRKGRDLQVDVTLTFEEAAFGIKKPINITRYEECATCNGTGAFSKEDISTCGRCHGSGKVIVEQSTLLGRFRTESACPDCRGTGKKIKRNCPDCSGVGRSKKSRTINVNIPAGIDDDQTIRLSGEGEAGIKGGPSGDLLIHIGVKPHELFKREENNIILELPITFSQAALGCAMDVRTIQGMVNLKIPSGTQNGTKFKLANKGIENKINGRTGHQFVIVNVITPTNLTSKQKEIFSELSKTDETTNNRLFDRIKKFFKPENKK